MTEDSLPQVDGVPPKYLAAYHRGRNSRLEGKEPGGRSTDSGYHSWARAGWHDADMELGNRVLPPHEGRQYKGHHS